MNKDLIKIPSNLITGKDLDYLNDMFKWNYMSLKMVNNCIKNMKDDDVIDFFETLNDFFYENLNNILDILDNGGCLDE